MLIRTLFLLLAFSPLFGWADIQGAPFKGTLLDHTGKPAKGVVYVQRVPLLGDATLAAKPLESSLSRTTALGEFVLENFSVGRYSLCVKMDDPALLSYCEAFPALAFDIGTKEELPILLRAIRGVQVHLAITDNTGALAIGKKLRVGLVSKGGYFRQAAVSDRRHGLVSFRATIPPGDLRYFVLLDLDPSIVLRDDKGMVWEGQVTRLSIDTNQGDQTFRFDVAWSGKGIGVD